MNSLEWALTQNYHLYKKRNKKDHEKTQGEGHLQAKERGPQKTPTLLDC